MDQPSTSLFQTQYLNIIQNSTQQHKCHECGKHFATNNYLETHKRLHTGDRPFQCHVCGRKFSQRPGFTYHMRSVHTGEKRYSCTLCGKKFIQLGTVKRHVETHPEAKVALGGSLDRFVKKLECTSDSDLLKFNQGQLDLMKSSNKEFFDNNVLEPGQIPNQFVYQQQDQSFEQVTALPRQTSACPSLIFTSCMTPIQDQIPPCAQPTQASLLAQSNIDFQYKHIEYGAIHKMSNSTDSSDDIIVDDDYPNCYSSSRRPSVNSLSSGRGEATSDSQGGCCDHLGCRP